jgi:type IV secretory pathway VirB10-like protein
MESRFTTFARTALVLVLVTALSGAPSAFAQQAQPATNPNTTPTPVPQTDQASQQPTQTPVPGNTQADPTQGPLEPVAPAPLPDSPSAAQPQTQQPTTVQTAPASNAPAVPSGHQPIDPQGAATAETAPTLGGAASKPAGAAIAPAKQRQMRSFLIKLGAIAGAGVALGTVYALTRGTSSTPPGAK